MPADRTFAFVRATGTYWHGIEPDASLLLSLFALVCNVGARWTSQRWMCSGNRGRWGGLRRIRRRYCGGALARELVMAFARVEERRDYIIEIQDRAQQQASTRTTS
jgi:hypothetical protein